MFVKKFHDPLSPGKQCVTLVDEDDIPLDYPGLFISQTVSRSRYSINTQERMVRDLQFFLLWWQERNKDGGNLLERIQAGEYLTQDEIERFSDAARLKREEAFREPNVAPLHPEIQQRIVMEAVYAGQVKRSLVKAQTTNYRLVMARRYINHLIQLIHGLNESWELRQSREDMIHAFELEMRPVSSDEQANPDNPKGSEPEISDTAMTGLGLLIENDPSSMYFKRIWKNSTIQERNCLIIDLLRTTGIRRSELCGIKLDDIDFSTHKLRIIRRPNDKADRRALTSEVKTLSHTSVLPAHLRRRIKDYIVDIRSKVPGVQGTEYLFVAHQGETCGRELSLKTVSKIFIPFSRALGEPISAHKLRHRFVQDLKSLMDELKIEAEEQAQIMRQLLGWGPNSDMPAKVYDVYNLNQKAVRAITKLNEKRFVPRGAYDNSINF
ncbi:TPA: site-specific integrase [Vibrio cholerae]|nr:MULTISPECIES: site-specific integrase [Vibrio]MBF4251913.1 site-specific integrase [Vibrio anguillarum]MBF4386545.1 site-specific integrase [Vibrio anguillarum]MBF4403076.1 site-specific integrase [Vibrio anguillarum]TQP63993.1 site-specific integrase [Vibrio cholerae]HDZ9267179.1 site-specific integrase [Vibrio cholerae]